MHNTLDELLADFRVSAGMSEAGASEGGKLALQAALKQHFFKSADTRTIEFRVDADEVSKVNKVPSNWTLDPQRRGADVEDEYFEAKIKDIVVDEDGGYPIIKVTFAVKSSDYSIKNADLDPVVKQMSGIIRNLYPKAQISTDDVGKDYFVVVT